jgi:hypothetical protein
MFQQQPVFSFRGNQTLHSIPTGVIVIYPDYPVTSQYEDKTV